MKKKAFIFESINIFFNIGNVNWDAVESILDHGLNNCMRINKAEFPLLFAESHFNTLTHKAKVTFSTSSS